MQPSSISREFRQLEVHRHAGPYRQRPAGRVVDVVYGNGLVHGGQSRVIADLRLVKLLARPPLLVGQIGDGEIELITLHMYLAKRSKIIQGRSSATRSSSP